MIKCPYCSSELQVTLDLRKTKDGEVHITPIKEEQRYQACYKCKTHTLQIKDYIGQGKHVGFRWKCTVCGHRCQKVWTN